MSDSVLERDPIGGLTLKRLSEAPDYLQRASAVLSRHLQGKILELGCGTGNLTKYLAMEFPITTVDIDTEYLKVASQNVTAHSERVGRSHQPIDFRKGDLLAPAPAEWRNQFDSILSCQVLEHFEDDTKVLANYLSCLKPGGRVVLQLPANHFAFSDLDRNLGHHRRYSRDTVRQLLERVGVKPVEIYYFNFVGLLGWLWAGKIRRQPVLPAREMKIFNRMVHFALAPDVIMKRVTGLNVVAVGIKP